jgi:DNA-binding MarR family transcriptional regulator
MKAERHRHLALLTEISQGGHVTQRSLAQKLGIALGLTNLYLKRLARKGYIKITTIPPNRIRYLLTPKGLAEKTRLTYEYMHYSVHLYRETRRLLRETFRELAEAGRKRVVFYGGGEAAELSYLTLQETELSLAAVVDPDLAGQAFFDRTILPLEALPALDYDQVVVTAFQGGDRVRAALRTAGVPAEKISTLRR